MHYGFDENTPIMRGDIETAYRVESRYNGGTNDDEPPLVLHEAYQPIHALLDAIDTHIPTPQPEIDKPFLIPIEDVFDIEGHGVVVTGHVERGKLSVNSDVELVGFGNDIKTITVTGIEMFHKLLDHVETGDNAGLVLRGVEHDEIQSGQVLAQVESIKSYTTFEAEIYVLKRDEGGRNKPLLNGERPQFFIRTAGVSGRITLPEGVEQGRPGDHVMITVELDTRIALEKGVRFAIREHGLTVGAGFIHNIIG